MQAVILTAGLARRMQPLSDDCHKALLSIGQTTILGRIMDGLSGIGVSRVTVVTGYRAEDIRQFLDHGYPDLDIRYLHNERFEVTNNIVSLALALGSLEYDQDVLLLECDLILSPEILQDLSANPAPNVALLDRYRVGMDGTVVALSDGLVSQVFPPRLQDRDFSFRHKYKTLNVYKFHRDFCRDTLRPLLDVYAGSIDDNCYYEVVLGMLPNVPACTIAGQTVDSGLWAEVDDPNDLAVARYRFAPEERPAILDRALGGHWGFDVLDFSFMRNAFFPTEPMMSMLRHALPDVLGCYGSSQVVLNEKLSYFLRCRPERLQVLHGAAQAYPVLAELWAGRRAAVPAPTFGEYQRLFPDAPWYADAPGVAWSEVEEVAAGSDVLVVVNPNNPTGTVTDSGAILDFASRNPTVTVLVDESFQMFSLQPSVIPALEAAALTNVVVLTSLSKSLGTPGLRLGFVYSCDGGLIDAVGARLPVWNLSSLTELFLELLLKFRSELDRSIEQTIEAREMLRHGLMQLPIVERVHESGGNFLMVDLEGGDAGLASEVRAQLLRQFSIEVKDVSPRFPDRRPRLRLGVRTPAENGRLEAALAAIGVGSPA